MERSLVEWEEARNVADKVNILDVTEELGMKLTQVGRRYYWSDHDSLVISPHRNSYYWNSQGRGGGPIQLVQAVKECSFKEAIGFLEEKTLGEFDATKIPKKAPFTYFVKEHQDLTPTYDYLTNDRQLSKQTVDFFVDQGVLKQGTYRDKEKHHEETAIVFKHTDFSQGVKGMSYQGITPFPDIHKSRPYLKRTFGNGYYGLSVTVGDIPTGNKISVDTPLKIIAFEAPIDLMSYYELHKDSLADVTLISMNGLRKETLSTYIANAIGSTITEEKKQTLLDDMQVLATDKTSAIELTLAVDNDKAGREFVQDFGIDFITVKSELPPLAKGADKADWNDLLKQTKERTMEKNSEPSHYYRVEFNETDPDKGIHDLEGKRVTPELIQHIKELDTQVAQQNSVNYGRYYKFYFDEIKEAEKVDSFRLDVGSGVTHNVSLYSQLETITSQLEQTLVQTGPTPPVKEPSQPFSYNYLVSFEKALDETLERVPVESQPTHHYLTEKDVKALLSDHLNKVEQLFKHYDESSNLLGKATPEQGETLRMGLIDTIKEVGSQYKAGLAASLQEKKENAITQTKGSIQAVRESVSHAFSSRILKLNQSIQSFVDKVDKRFNKDLAEEEAQPEVAQPPIEPTVKEHSPSEGMIELAREFSFLKAESEQLSMDIATVIKQNPLSDVSALQEKVRTNQQRLEEIGNQIDAIRTPLNPDTVIESKMDTAAKLSLLVGQRDSLIFERDQWVNHPDFLYAKTDVNPLDSPLAQFNKCDAKINVLNQMIQELQLGKDIDHAQIFSTIQGESPSNPLPPTPPVQQVKAERVEKELTPEETATITTAVQQHKTELLKPEMFKQFLDSSTQFHSYSPNNVQMIMQQAPDAVQVASEAKWRQLGYELTETAQPIYVYAPSKDSTQVNGAVDFYLKPVYDVSQTTAEQPIQSFVLNEKDVTQYANVIQGLTTALPDKQLATDLSFATVNMPVKDTLTSYIDLVVDQTLKTSSTGSQREFEVNAVSYVVANHLGLDTKDKYSLDGLSQFNDSPVSMKQLDQSLKTIAKQSNKLVESIDKSVQPTGTVKNKFEQRVMDGVAKNKQVAANNPSHSQEQQVSRSR